MKLGLIQVDNFTPDGYSERLDRLYDMADEAFSRALAEQGDVKAMLIVTGSSTEFRHSSLAFSSTGVTAAREANTPFT